MPTSWYRGSSGLDDVTVLVSGGGAAPGRSSFVPQPGARNVVWLAAGQHVADGDFAVVVSVSEGVDGVLSAV